MGLNASAYFWASALLACRVAYLAAMPWEMAEYLKTLKASAQLISGRGSQPAASLYQPRMSSGVGRPGVAPGRKAAPCGLCDLVASCV